MSDPAGGVDLEDDDVKQRTRRARRLLNRLLRYAALPVRAGKVFASEGIAGCIERIRLRLPRQSERLTPERRYAHWRAENENEPVPEVAGAATGQFTVLLMSVDPPADRLARALEAFAAQCAGCAALELLAVVATREPSIRRIAEQSFAHLPHGQLRVVDDAESIAPAANALLRARRGEYVLVTDADGIPAEGGLCRVMAAQLAHRDCSILYGDQDSLNDDGERGDPFFKPDYSPELLQSFNYIGPTFLVRRGLLDEIGGVQGVPDRAYACDLLFRALDRSPRVHHVREILIHRLPATSAVPMQPVASTTALAASFARRGIAARVTRAGSRTEVRFERAENPLVSIIIPSDNAENSIECISRLLARTGYGAIEVLLVTNSRVARVIEATFGDARVRCATYDRPFNFSDKCNAGAAAARGKYYVFFNDDVAPLSRDWVERLLEYAQQPGIGGVSPRMLYETGTTQYAGMVTGVRDFVGTSFHCWEPDDERYHGLANCVRNVSILCGACMMVSRSAFEAIGGWDAKNTPIAHSDLSFSFELALRGYRLVYTPLAEMRHVGAKSRHDDSGWRHLDDEAHYFVLQRYGDRLGDDPYFPAGMRGVLYDDFSQFRIFAPKQSGDDRQPPSRRILLIAHELSLSGAPMVVLEMARCLKRNGDSVCVVSPCDGKLRSLFERDGIPVIVDEWILSRPRATSRFWGAFDLVVVNTVLGWKCVGEAARLGKPNVFLIHESDFGIDYIESQGAAARKAFAVASAVVFSSRKTQRLYEPYRGNAPYFEFRYGIADVDREAISRPLPRPDGRLLIAHSGTLEPRKGQDLLVEAVRRLPKNILDRIEVCFVGRDDDPVRTEYVAQLKRRAAGFPIQFCGEVLRDEALARMAASDIFVCTSTEETGPLVVYEAMALGKPVVTTRVGAAVQVVAEGESGFVIDVGDVDALRDRLTSLVLADEAERIRLGSAGRRVFEEQLTIDQTGSRFAALFDSLLAERGNRAGHLAAARAA